MSARTQETTHKIMSSIKQKDTEPELLLRRSLWAHGLRFRKNYTGLPGKPDVVFTRAKIAVFCDGDFWHGHNWALRGLESFEEELKNYSPFWQEKLMRNIERDKKVTQALEAEGWRVLRIWESDIRKDLDSCVDLIVSEYNMRIKSNVATDYEG